MLRVSLAPQTGSSSVRQLLVLIPDTDADLTPVASRVWEMAGVNGAHVRFLSLFDEAAREPGLRRRLTTLSAQVNDGRVTSDVEVIPGRDWVPAVRSRWQAGDMVICLSDHRTGLRQRPLSQILGSDLDLPLTVLSGITPLEQGRTKWYTQAAVWAGLIAILIGFCLLQARIIQTAGEWSMVLLLGSILVEFGVLWLWNSLF